MGALDMEVPTLHWADYLVFGLFLAASASIGIFYGYKSKKNAKTETAKSFLTGGGDMHYFPVGLSMMASFLSAIFVLSFPSEITAFGVSNAYMSISYLTGFSLSGHVHLPIFFKLGVTSGYEYLELRFSKTVRIAGAITFSAMILIYLSVVLYTPALALSQVTQMPMVASILGVGAVCTFYTVLGGMKATIWNDALQMTILLICLIIILIIGTAETGGLVNVFDKGQKGGRLDTNFDPNPFLRSTFWTTTIGATMINITMFASSQTIIQKFLSTRSIRQGQKAVWVAAIVNSASMVMIFILGIMMYAYYEFCDPVASGRAQTRDQMVPLFVMDIMGNLHGLPGLFLATTFSAALSSLSGSLNALAAVFLEDLIKPAYEKIKGKEVPHGAVISRILALTFGIMTIAMSFLTKFLGDTVIQIALSIFGMIGSPLLAILTLGMFFPFVNSAGALSGLLASLVITCWVGCGRIILEIPNVALPVSTEGCFNGTGAGHEMGPSWLTSTMNSTIDETPERTWLLIYDLAYMYYSVLSMLVATVVAIPVSLATGRNKGRDLDPRLFFTFKSEGPWCSDPEPPEVEAGPEKVELVEQSIEAKPGDLPHTKQPSPGQQLEQVEMGTGSIVKNRTTKDIFHIGFSNLPKFRKEEPVCHPSPLELGLFKKI